MWNAQENDWPKYTEGHKRGKHTDIYRPGDDPNSNNMWFKNDLDEMKTDNGMVLSIFRGTKKLLGINGKRLKFDNIMSPLIYSLLYTENDTRIDEHNDFQLSFLDSYSNDTIVGKLFNLSLENNIIKYFIDTTRCKRRKEGTKREAVTCSDGVV